MSTTTTTHFRLIVDTSDYSGNFERESVAYATGLLGEDMDAGPGKDQAALARVSLDPDTLAWWAHHVVYVADEEDDDGVAIWPMAMWPTPGIFTNISGGTFTATPEGRAEAREKMIEAATELSRKEIRELNLIEPDTNGWTTEKIAQFREASLDRLGTVSKMTHSPEWEILNSVAVLVDEMPSDARLAEFEARMTEYLSNIGVKVIGFAVETETKTVAVERTIRRRQAP